MENIIKIHLKEKEDYKNTYNEEILSYKLSNYILEELKGIDTKQQIEFEVSSEFNMDQSEKESLVDMIRNNFGADISEIIHIFKKQQISNYLIFLTGVTFITISSFLKIKLLSQFVLIFGWVLLGEAICNLLYKKIENNLKIKRRKQIVNAKIFFK